MRDPMLTTGGHPVDMIRLSECLERISRVLENVIDFEEMLTVMIREARDLIGCEAGSVARYDELTDSLTFYIVAGGAEGRIESWEIPSGQGIVGEAAATRMPVICNDPAGDPRWLGRDDDRVSGFVTRNLAAVPMLRGGRLVGVLEVINTSQPDGFSADDTRFLQIFANHAALALQLQGAIEAKAHSDRMAGVGMAIGDLSHTMKNILQKIEFPLSLFDDAMQKQQWEALGHYWTGIKNGIGDARTLARELLGYTKEQKLKPEPTDVGMLLARVVDSHRAEADRAEIDLVLAGEFEGLTWNLDATAVERALENLLANALEAMDSHRKGMEVKISVETGPFGLRMTVSDDGPGMPEKIKARAFEPFVTGKSTGTGFGLPNVRRCVEGHGGKVTLSSEEGIGTTFVLTFPASANG